MMTDKKTVLHSQKQQCPQNTKLQILELESEA